MKQAYLMKKETYHVKQTNQKGHRSASIWLSIWSNYIIHIIFGNIKSKQVSSKRNLFRSKPYIWEVRKETHKLFKGEIAQISPSEALMIYVMHYLQNILRKIEG